MKRFFIVAIIVLAVLYLVALGVGFQMNRDDFSLADVQKSWFSKVGGWIAGPWPRLDLKQLNCIYQPAGTGMVKVQPADRLIALTEAKPSCSISIPPVDPHGPKYRKTSVSVLGGGASLFVFARFDKTYFPEAKRSSDCFYDRDLPKGFRLMLKYQPTRKQEGDLWSCWLRKQAGEAADFMAMRDGGTLTLTCVGCCARCDAGRPKELRLRLK